MKTLQYWQGVKDTFEYLDEELGTDLADSSLYLEALDEIEKVLGRI
jgi:hypothetical protein